MQQTRSRALLLLLLLGCTSTEKPAPIDCTLSNLQVTLLPTNPTTCTSADGSIKAQASGGSSPYTFKLSTGEVSADGAFSGLNVGSYTITVQDINGCQSDGETELILQGNTFKASVSATEDTECLENNGTITVNASGGEEPYEYKLDNGVFVSASTFMEVNGGQHSLRVKDATGCTLTKTISVPSEHTGITYLNSIQTVIKTKCSVESCHNSASQSVDFTVFTNLQSFAQTIKQYAIAGTMPPQGATPLTTKEVQLIVCWVDGGAKKGP